LPQVRLPVYMLKAGMRLHETLSNESMFRIKNWALAGVVAAALTGVIPLLPENGAVDIIGIPLSIGVLFGGALFGGLHNAPPVVPVFAIAGCVNAALWGGAFRLTRWGRRWLGQPKSFDLDVR